jgi:glycosyltransferase involved in cell wall biosynthesis
MIRKILTFGHLPKHIGGQQQQGLAAVMWATASHIHSCVTGYDVIFCATDVKKPFAKINGIQVIGWTRISMITSILFSPFKFILLFKMLAPLCQKYELPIIRHVFKAYHLQQTIFKRNPDFIHLHTCEAILYIESKIVEPSKTFVTIHGVYGQKGPHNFTIMEASLNRYNVMFIAFVTEKISKIWCDFHGSPASAVIVTPNTLDRSHFYLTSRSDYIPTPALNKEVYRLITVGSLTDNKGQERVLAALKIIKNMELGFDIEYTLVGADKINLIDKYFSNGDAIEINVKHLPYLSPDELRIEISCNDYMIMPSKNEGYGLVFIESIACGVPVVLPQNLAICGEPGVISSENAVLLDNYSIEEIVKFLTCIQSFNFNRSEVSKSLNSFSWKDVALKYSSNLPV